MCKKKNINRMGSFSIAESWSNSTVIDKKRAITQHIISTSLHIAAAIQINTNFKI